MSRWLILFRGVHKFLHPLFGPILHGVSYYLYPFCASGGFYICNHFYDFVYV